MSIIFKKKNRDSILNLPNTSDLELYKQNKNISHLKQISSANKE